MSQRTSAPEEFPHHDPDEPPDAPAAGPPSQPDDHAPPDSHSAVLPSGRPSDTLPAARLPHLRDSSGSTNNQHNPPRSVPLSPARSSTDPDPSPPTSLQHNAQHNAPSSSTSPPPPPPPPLPTSPPSMDSPLTPSALRPLLDCPLCPPSSPLVAPVTLYCGHALCAKHVRSELPASASSQAARDTPSGRLRLTPCPLGCTASPSRPLRAPNIPASSRVAYYPAAGPHHNAAAIAFESVPDHRTDITINKLAAIIHRHDQRTQPTVFLPTLDPDTDSETDEEVSDTEQSSPPAFTAGVDSGSPSGSPSGSSKSRQPASEQNPIRRQARKRRRRHFPPPRRMEPPAQSADRFEKELLTELSCEICFMLLYQPVTSPCQHTFCAKCLHRSLDHGNHCPLCRQELPGFAYFQDHPYNKTITSIIIRAFPEAYAERGRTIEQEERHARLDTPIFVCQLSFPGLPTVLHFFEPRYRLMLRRCLESPNPCFGMIMPPSPLGERSAGNDFGTMLEIKSVRMLADGRSMVETWGTYRFRIMERGSMDGYMVGRIERIFDYPSLYPNSAVDVATIPSPVHTPTNIDASVRAVLDAASGAGPSSNASEAEPPRSPAQEMQELVDVCLAFLDQIQRGAAPWVVQRLNNTYGPMPTDPTHFSYWMAMVLPIEDAEKAKLLPVKSPLLRLRLVVYWIEQLNSNWWFTNGCVVS